MLVIKISSLLIQAVLLLFLQHATVKATSNTTPGTINCTDLTRNRVLGFNLLDGSQNPNSQIVTSFKAPYVIDLNNFENCDMNVGAVLATPVPENCDINNVRCVRFYFGDVIRRDFVSPFTAFLKSGGSGLPIDRTPAPGIQTLKACPYANATCDGPRSGCYEVQVNVIGCNNPVPVPVPVPASIPAPVPISLPVPVTAPLPVSIPVSFPVLVPVPVPTSTDICTFTVSEAFSDSFAIDVTITITPISNNEGLKITVTESDPDSIGDLRGLFFDVSRSFSLGAASDITGAQVTDRQVARNGVIKLSNGANMQGNGNKMYDVGVEIGTQGLGVDDIQSTVIFVKWPGLTLAHLCGQAFGVRLTSTGPIGKRSKSSKIFGLSCACPSD